MPSSGVCVVHLKQLLLMYTGLYNIQMDMFRGAQNDRGKWLLRTHWDNDYLLRNKAIDESPKKNGPVLGPLLPKNVF